MVLAAAASAIAGEGSEGLSSRKFEPPTGTLRPGSSVNPRLPCNCTNASVVVPPAGSSSAIKFGVRAAPSTATAALR